MLTCIALLLMLIPALVASAPSATHSPAFLTGAREKGAMTSGLPLVRIDLAMKRSTNLSRPLGIGAFRIDCDAMALIARISIGGNLPADSPYLTPLVGGWIG